MTNDQSLRNDEGRMTNELAALVARFVIRHLGIHSSFVIGHSSFPR